MYGQFFYHVKLSGISPRDMDTFEGTILITSSELTENVLRWCTGTSTMGHFCWEALIMMFVDIRPSSLSLSPVGDTFQPSLVYGDGKSILTSFASWIGTGILWSLDIFFCLFLFLGYIPRPKFWAHLDLYWMVSRFVWFLWAVLVPETIWDCKMSWYCELSQYCEQFVLVSRPIQVSIWVSQSVMV